MDVGFEPEDFVISWKKKPTWIVQNNLGSTGNFETMEAHARAKRIPFNSVKIRPFTDDVPDDVEGKVVVYGSCGMIRAARKTRLSRGIFDNEEGFKLSTWRQHYGKALLNYEASSLPIEDFLILEPHAEEGVKLFIRSDDDEKTIAGHVTDFQTFFKIKDLYKPDQKILVSRYKEILAEFRSFIVDGKVISVSRYGHQYGTKLDSFYVKLKESKQEIEEFANKMAAIYCPHRVFVMDVCYTPDGLKIVELNGFNSAGFYDCDIPKIMDAVNSTL